MTSYLYVLSIGPVQDFIAAARRTRDLWFGSHLLSEVSKAAAKCIATDEGILIFPALEAESEDLKPSTKLDAFNVANIILAELPDGIDQSPKEIDLKAQVAACARWMIYAEEAKEVAGDAVRSDIWKEQVSNVPDIISFYSAWVPLTPNYKDSRRRLMRLLSGRKSIRDFSQVKGRAGIPKSSLDGARESVLTDDKEVRKMAALGIKLAEGEQLCAVGLTKRLGGGRVSFPSVSRVALDPWIRGVVASDIKAKRLLNDIKTICEEDNDFSSKVDSRFTYYKDFPFDGQVLYPFRLSRLLKMSTSDSWEDQLSDMDLEKLKQIKEKAGLLQKSEKGGIGLGEPDPYLAILVADGDHMGKAISEMDSIDKHRKFSKQLASFAGDARKIVEDCRGSLVYSGGDDVLAFLPVDCCLNAARKLYDRFGKIKAEDGKPLTLSIGIAIGHFLEPLEYLLGYGRDAEKAAKGDDRNGLAIHLHTRGGGDPICIRKQWKDKDGTGLDAQLTEWAKMYNDNLLPDKVAYELRQLASDYESWDDTSNGTSSDTAKAQKLGKAIPADVKRLLKRKRPGAESQKIPDDRIDRILKGVDSYDRVRQLSEELVLARKLAVIISQAEPRSKREEAY